MRTVSIRIFLLTIICFLLSQPTYAQATENDSSGTFVTVTLLLVVIIAFAVIVQVSDNLLRIEADKSGASNQRSNFSVFPRLNELFAPAKPAYTGNSVVHRLQKGFDINLYGEAEPKIDEGIQASTFAIQPPDFRGIAPIPKLEVEIGASVKAGDPVFYDKNDPDIKYVAPVSGEIIAVNRGDRRSIAEIVILADKEQQYRELPGFELENSSREELVNYLISVGAWNLFRHRPYNIVADKHDIPDNIFISTFDSAPLAPDLDFVVEGRGAAFQKGLDVLQKLTKGKVHLGLNAGKDKQPSAIFTEAKGVEKHWFQGKHPAGNVGIQIHHIDPITPKSMVWTLGVQEVITLGAIFTEGRWNTERVVALTGSELNEPKYVKTHVGAKIDDLLKGNLANDHVRFISGDVLSGQKKTADGFIGFFDDQVTVIEEGDMYEMFGWLIPDTSTPSASKALPTAIFSGTKLKANTNTHGEKRAFRRKWRIRKSFADGYLPPAPDESGVDQ